jgi:opacity protein-like surface antigen/outer membrane protein OmpA-like peptidoglycan-associated protein
MSLRLCSRPITAALASMALCASMTFAQDSSNSSKQTSSNQASSGSSAAATMPPGCVKIIPPDPKEKVRLPDDVELDPFGGISLFGQVNRGLDTKMLTGYVFGGRVGANVSKYIGLELMYEQMKNNVRFLTPIAPGLPTYDFANRNYYLALNPVFHFTPKGSRVRPYVTVGVGAAQFTPQDSAKSFARTPAVDAVYHSANLNDNLQVALNYGGGIKFHLSDHFGLRFDARGFLSRNPTYNLPNYPLVGLYIPRNDKLNGVQVTAGLIWYLGKKFVPQPTQEPLPPLGAATITGGDTGGVLCQGKAITLHAEASDPAGHPLTYTWKLNGAPQGSNSPDFSFTPNNAGDFNVELEVADSTCATRKATAPAKTLNVKEISAPVISSFTVSPKELSCRGDNTVAQLQSQATGSACGGNLTYKWTASEGSVSNDSTANATFDSKSLNFDQNAAQTQTKSVTVTLTVTDETGKSATQNDTLTVKCDPLFVRLDDIIFAKNNSRVNNCGKRILIDEVAPKLNDPNYTVVLVGHYDKDEQATPRTAKGRRARAEQQSLDEARALNSAAVLTGGTGTCAKIDPSQVQVDWVADDQTAEARPGLCGSSNRAEQKERKTSATSESDKFRRVEVYLVPKGQPMPPSVKNPKPLPADVMKKLGCPK